MFAQNFFCKNRYYESVWDRFFFSYKLLWNALLNLITNCKILSSFLKNSATNFQKMVSIEGPLLFLCDCVLHWSLFILPLCLQPSQKSVGEYFTNFFLMFFFVFLKTNLQNCFTDLLLSMNRTHLKIFPQLYWHRPAFSREINGYRKNKILSSDRFLETFWNFLWVTFSNLRWKFQSNK